MHRMIQRAIRELQKYKSLYLNNSILSVKFAMRFENNSGYSVGFMTGL